MGGRDDFIFTEKKMPFIWLLELKQLFLSKLWIPPPSRDKSATMIQAFECQKVSVETR
jgi:hypothetical protein